MLAFELSSKVSLDEKILIGKKKVLLFKNKTDEIIYYLKDDDENWNKKDINNLDIILKDFGVRKQKTRNPHNNDKIIAKFKSNFDRWKNHNNFDLDFNLKKEVIWFKDKENREKSINVIIDYISNNSDYYSLYKSYKSLEIYKDLYKANESLNEKDSRKIIQKCILDRIANTFAEKITLRFNRFCDISPYFGNGWWSICSIPISYWTTFSTSEWKDILLIFKEQSE